MSIEHVRSSHEFGEVHPRWRCLECGEMGALDDGLPDSRPSCGPGREASYYWTED
ncbi:DUF7130 family rubredoxin-like protein [Natronolimnohabitans innermongolicus]|uniref:DUF7130 domain-containing protein n=1 Tax=Natronolimnohabitans innermongolicus JCM 12255 TaxID=1227499 RepID=L9X3E5_9EURY|nr:hypothetical protein [Natronolimnohabitans innermongolicus]ELY55093.1 hypothetical protein C493_11442 [Natronolimnohabitans innermongolicus JCM 12255]